MAKKFRDKSDEMMNHYFNHKRDEQLEMRRLVEATTAGQQNVKEARAKLTAMKQKIGWCKASLEGFATRCLCMRQIYYNKFHKILVT